MRLTLATYNIQHGKGMDGRVNLARAEQVLKDLNADVICIQEVERRSPRTRFMDQPRHLAEALGMTPVFGPALKAPQFGEYGLLILSRLPVQGSRVHPLPGPKEPRVVVEATVEVEGGLVSVFTTHFGLSLEERSAHAPATAAIVSASAYPSLLAGDFNEEPAADGPAHRAMEAAGLFRLAPGQPTHPSTQPKATIDHVFGSGGWVVRESAVVDSLASDHCPVLVQVEYASPL
jgi:endonuclease/exonuclease/phosphatase family metal-dependent hydrolase